MFSRINLFILCFILTYVITQASELQIKEDKKVSIEVYYITINLEEFHYSTRFIVEVLDYVKNIKLYPYGNTEMFMYEGEYRFVCTYGSRHCYANRLHACAIDVLQNNTESFLFNACLTQLPRDGIWRSDDRSAALCGKRMSVDSKAITDCAKSDKSTELVKNNAEETEKMDIALFPYFTLDGKRVKGNLTQAICDALDNVPPACI